MVIAAPQEPFRDAEVGVVQLMMIALDAAKGLNARSNFRCNARPGPDPHASRASSAHCLPSQIKALKEFVARGGSILCLGAEGGAKKNGHNLNELLEGCV